MTTNEIGKQQEEQYWHDFICQRTPVMTAYTRICQRFKVVVAVVEKLSMSRSHHVTKWQLTSMSPPEAPEGNQRPEARLPVPTTRRQVFHGEGAASQPSEARVPMLQRRSDKAPIPVVVQSGGRRVARWSGLAGGNTPRFSGNWLLSTCEPSTWLRCELERWIDAATHLASREGERRTTEQRVARFDRWWVRGQHLLP